MAHTVSVSVVHQTVLGIPSTLAPPKPGVLHLWSTKISPDYAPAIALSAVLSPDEQVRGQRYIVSKARCQFVETRGLLRFLLGTYLHTDPRCIDFHYSENGKPSLTQPRDVDFLQFNVSHSQEQILYAISTDSPVGIDLEGINPAISYREIAHRICTPQEWAMFTRLPPQEQALAFFKLWTRKEALVKLSGDRLYEKLSIFEVPVCATSGSYWIQAESRNLWLQDLDLFESFAAAIALPAAPTDIIHHEWHYAQP